MRRMGFVGDGLVHFVGYERRGDDTLAIINNYSSCSLGIVIILKI